MCRGIIQMVSLLDLKNDCNGMVLLFNKNVRILITENAGSEGVYRAVLTGMLNRIQCVRTMLLIKYQIRQYQAVRSEVLL